MFVRRKCTGLSRLPKLWASTLVEAVGERSVGDTSYTVRSNAAYRSDYAGISNEKTGETPVRRKPKVSSGKDHPPGVSRYLSRGRKE